MGGLISCWRFYSGAEGWKRCCWNRGKKPPSDPPSVQTTLSSSLPQVYTRLHLIASDPRAQAGHLRRLRVRVRPERLAALPHVGGVCGEPAEADLGAGALHRRMSYHEVGVAVFPFAFLALVFCMCGPLRRSPLSTETVVCSCWCSPRPTWKLRASGSLSRSAWRWNPTPPWRRVDRSISGKLCKFTVIQSTYFFFFLPPPASLPLHLNHPTPKNGQLCSSS